MPAFRFAPELYEARSRAIEALGDAGYQWFSDFSSIDALHDVYGIEVCGINDPEDAAAIDQILHRLFPDWNYGAVCYDDYGPDPGWEVCVCRNMEDFDEEWDEDD